MVRTTSTPQGAYVSPDFTITDIKNTDGVAILPDLAIKSQKMLRESAKYVATFGLMIKNFKIYYMVKFPSRDKAWNGSKIIVYSFIDGHTW